MLILLFDCYWTRLFALAILLLIIWRMILLQSTRKIWNPMQLWCLWFGYGVLFSDDMRLIAYNLIANILKFISATLLSLSCWTNCTATFPTHWACWFKCKTPIVPSSSWYSKLLRGWNLWKLQGLLNSWYFRLDAGLLLFFFWAKRNSVYNLLLSGFVYVI